MTQPMAKRSSMLANKDREICIDNPDHYSTKAKRPHNAKQPSQINAADVGRRIEVNPLRSLTASAEALIT
jgi:hypothetical protein